MNELINDIVTIEIDSEDDENNGVVIVNTFQNKLVGLCISKKYGSDVEIWLNSDDATKLYRGIEEALKLVK